VFVVNFGHLMEECRLYYIVSFSNRSANFCTDMLMPSALRSCVCFLCYYTFQLYYILEILYVLTNLCQSDGGKY
jgi:hypothetical protein